MGFSPTSCLFKLSLVFLAFLLSVFGLLCSSFSPSLLTISLLSLSTAVITFNFTKKKHILGENTSHDHVISSGTGLEHPLQKEVGKKILPESSILGTEKEYQQVRTAVQMSNCIAGSPELSSDSESVDISLTSEESDINWSYPYNVAHFPACSDCSISDDESLIEIALPNGHFVADSGVFKGIFRRDLLEFSPESILKEHGLMEHSSEINEYMNEDDNMIEIDISMGSIKCSRVEIEAKSTSKTHGF